MSESDPDILQHINMDPYCYDLLSEKAQVAVSNKTTTLLHQYNVVDSNGNYVRHVCPVVFLGYMCVQEEVADVMEILASKINELAEKDFILASLSTMIVIPLADPASPLVSEFEVSINGKRKYAVISYLAIPTLGEEYIKEYMPYLQMGEGGAPKCCTLEPLDKWEDFNTYDVSEE